MRASALGEAVADLPWLCPGADALLALARRDGAASWRMVRQDPAAVLWAVRCPQVFPYPATPFSPLSLQIPHLLENTCQSLRLYQDRGFVNWSLEGVRPIYEAALAGARVARRLAERTKLCDPEYAWMGGLLAPLGWLAQCGGRLGRGSLPGGSGTCPARVHGAETPLGAGPGGPGPAPVPPLEPAVLARRHHRLSGIAGGPGSQVRSRRRSLFHRPGGGGPRAATAGYFTSRYGSWSVRGGLHDRVVGRCRGRNCR